MEAWAKIVHPSTTKLIKTSDITSEILLNIMMGIPTGNGQAERIFIKFIACSKLQQHLTGSTVSKEEALKIRDFDHDAWLRLNRKALPAHV